MIDLTTHERQVLHSLRGARLERYQAELLDHNGTHKAYICFSSGALTVNSEYEVKKSANITVSREDYALIDVLRDKVVLSMGVELDNGMKWWTLGTFRIIKAKGRVLQLADETVLLQQAKVKEKKVFYKGSLYTDALKWFLISSGLTFFDIQTSPLTLQADIIVDDSKSKLAWFNTIAEQINYVNLYVSSNGYFTSKKYQEPRFDRVGYTYSIDKISVIKSISTDIDLWNVPNVFKRTVSRGDMPPLASIHINDNPTNKFSTTYRGIEICDFATVELIGSQEELDLLVSRIALKSQQLEEIVNIETINMPNHEVYDIIQIEDKLYEEVSYTIPLTHTGSMSHILKGVVYNV